MNQNLSTYPFTDLLSQGKNNGGPLGPPLFFDKKIWRIRDVAKYLGCTVGHVYNLVSEEKIPKIKKGKFLYFIPEHIYEWVLQGDLT